MSNPTSSLQLLGGLLSTPTTTGVNGLFSMANQPDSPATEAFYNLWVGLTQQGLPEQSLPSTEGSLQGQKIDQEGRELPLQLPQELLKSLKESLQEAESAEDFEQVVDLFKNALLTLLPADTTLTTSTPPQETQQLLPSDNPRVNDAQLLAYLQQLQAENSARPEKSSAVEDEWLSKMVSFLLEKEDALGSANGVEKPVITADEVVLQQAAEQRMQQLWTELQMADQQKQSLNADERAAASPPNDALRPALIPTSAVSADQPSDEAVTGVTQLVSNVAQSIPSVEVDVVIKDSPASNGEEESLFNSKQEFLLSEKSSFMIPFTQYVGSLEKSAFLTAESKLNQVIDKSVSPEVAAVVAATSRKPDDALVESRASQGSTPTLFNLLPESGQVNTPTTLAALGMSEKVLDASKRVLTDAIHQANAEKLSQESSSQDTQRRQEALISASALSDSAKLPQSPSSVAQAPLTQAFNSQDALMQKMMNPAWSRALGERAVMMAQQGPRLAEVRLDPPELGALRIKVQIHANDQISLSFTAPNAVVKDVLEQNLPRLREMFAEQGMNLADASVDDQSHQGQAQQSSSGERNAQDAAVKQEFGELPAGREKLKKIGIIDYYA